MSRKATIGLVILWEHEIRDAAKACDLLWKTLNNERSTERKRSAAFEQALRAMQVMFGKYNGSGDDALALCNMPKLSIKMKEEE